MRGHVQVPLPEVRLLEQRQVRHGNARQGFPSRQQMQPEGAATAESLRKAEGGREEHEKEKAEQ